MSDEIQLHISGPLRDHLDSQTGPGGLYESVDEYIRDLIRRDRLQPEETSWGWLQSPLSPLVDAPDDDFVELEAAAVNSRSRQALRTAG
jgi:Arc/MetJ-type ribon-helix-helix transcriptional regulator